VYPVHSDEDHEAAASALALELEAELRRRLAGVRLVLEAGLDDPTFERVQAVVNRLASASNGEHWLIARLPATLLVHLVGTGSRLEGGTFWPTATMKGSLDQQALAGGFERAIQQLHLERFERLADERALRFVAPILAHGGIPRYAAQQYIELLVGTLRRYGLTSAAEVAALWRSRRTALEFGLRPIRRFLVYGGEPALDYLGRSIEMARMGADDVRSAGVAELGLPPHVVEAYLAYLERSGQMRGHSRGPGAALPRPRVAIDPFDAGGPYLELPVVPPAAGRGTWSVDNGDAVLPLRSSPLETRRVPLAPAMNWSTELRLEDGSVRTTAFEALEQSPYVVFDPKTGTYVDDLRPITLGECWLLATREATIRATGPDGTDIEIRTVAVLPDPLGSWNGFSVRHLDLSGVASLTVIDPRIPGAELEGIVRVVAGATRPRLLGEPLDGVGTSDGSPVYSSAPALFVPRQPGFSDDRWVLTLTSPAGRRAIPLTELGASGRELQLDALIAGSNFGTFELVVRGPLGSDLRRRFGIVPGLAVSLPDKVLLPGEEAGRHIAVRAGTGMTIAEEDLPLRDGWAELPIPKSGDRLPIVVTRGSERLDLVVRIPRLQWAIRRVGTVPEFGSRRERVDADELIEGIAEALLLSTGLAGQNIKVSLESGAQVVQELPIGETGHPDGRWATSLAAFRDTVRSSASPHLTLAAEMYGRRVVVADVISAPKARDIAVERRSAEDGPTVSVSFSTARPIPDLVVRLWSRDRPWADPIIARVAEGAVEAVFDGVAVAVGRYRAEVAVDDPWFPARRPAASAPSTAEVEIGEPQELLHDYRARRRQGEPADLVSLAIVTGLAPPEWRPECVVDTWPALAQSFRALLADRPSDGTSERALAAVVHLMLADPRAAFEEMASPREGAEFDAREMLEWYLYAKPDLDSPPPTPDRVLRALWRSCPPLAAFVDVPQARLEDPEALARCDEFLGWRPDGPLPPVGKRPELAELSLSPPRQATIRDLLGLVPRAILTWDTYELACFEWLAACSANVPAAEQWRSAASWAKESVDELPELVPYLVARRVIKHPDYRWADGLRLSLACAAHVVAGDRLAGHASERLRQLLDIARLLVIHDLVLATALMPAGSIEALRGVNAVEQENDAPETRWRVLMDLFAHGEPITARVLYVEADGDVITETDGIKGRIKPRERGWLPDVLLTPPALGMSLEVVATGADQIQRRLELSRRRALPSPWTDPARCPATGDVVDAVVTGHATFGMFATTLSGATGLLHHSSLPELVLPDDPAERVAYLSERHPLGSLIKVRVLELDSSAERMTLTAA
jgi:hypothetical protein